MLLELRDLELAVGGVSITLIGGNAIEEGRT